VAEHPKKENTKEEVEFLQQRIAELSKRGVIERYCDRALKGQFPYVTVEELAASARERALNNLGSFRGEIWIPTGDTAPVKTPQGEKSLRNWLNKIVVNGVISYLQRTVRRERSFVSLDEETVPLPDPEDQEAQVVLITAIQQESCVHEPPWDIFDYAIFLLLRRGYEKRVIAREIGMPESTVRKRIEKRIQPVVAKVLELPLPETTPAPSARSQATVTEKEVYDAG
jgi:DNA-directed RNA polymerase specialized sigma24 family protein